MKKVSFIRHAQSEANAGAITSDDAAIVLSELGKRQAQDFANSVFRRPDVVVVSPYIRTLLTAQPLLDRFGDVPLLTMPVHEFTYLSPGVCAGTTANQRKHLVAGYWERNDPALIHGEGAESFDQFAVRVKKCLKVISHLPYERTMVFTHGHVLHLIWQLLSDLSFTDAKEQMRHFHEKMSLLPVANIGVFKAEVENDGMKIIEPNQPTT